MLLFFLFSLLNLKSVPRNHFLFGKKYVNKAPYSKFSTDMFIVCFCMSYSHTIPFFFITVIYSVLVKMLSFL